MNKDLLSLYQHIRESPALVTVFPEEFGKGRIVRLDTNTFGLSSWEMEFHKDTFVEGAVPNDLRLLICLGDGAEWTSDSDSMSLGHREACFCLSYDAAENMSYQGNTPYSFFSASIPTSRFTDMTGSFFPDPERILEILPGRRFSVSAKLLKILHDLGPLDSVHNGFEKMRLEAHLTEMLSYCLQAALCEPVRYRELHREDLQVIRSVGSRIEEDPAVIPDIAELAHEYGMSVSKLTRSFRQVYGTSLHAYVIEARLQKGASLLTHEGISVREAAEKLGYAKSSQFSADFRKRFGILPSEYRS